MRLGRNEMTGINSPAIGDLIQHNTCYFKIKGRFKAAFYTGMLVV